MGDFEAFYFRDLNALLVALVKVVVTVVVTLEMMADNNDK